MEYRLINKSEIGQLEQINRSEIIEEIYYVRNGKLELEEEYYDIDGWCKEELYSYIDRLHDLHDRGGKIYVACDGERIVGMAALESKFIRKNRLKFDLMYVDSAYRHQGVGRALFGCLEDSARESGASAMYISATPTRHTVDFYYSLGAVLTDEIDEELFELEPLDIHLEYKL